MSRHDFEVKIAALTEAFVKELPSRTDQLKACIDAYIGSSAETRMEKLQGVYEQSHKLGGAAGTFGFHALGRHAQELEVYSQDILEQAPTLDDEVQFKNTMAKIEKYWDQIHKTVLDTHL